MHSNGNHKREGVSVGASKESSGTKDRAFNRVRPGIQRELRERSRCTKVSRHAFVECDGCRTPGASEQKDRQDSDDSYDQPGKSHFTSPDADVCLTKGAVNATFDV